MQLSYFFLLILLHDGDQLFEILHDLFFLHNLEFGTDCFELVVEEDHVGILDGLQQLNDLEVDVLFLW